MTHTDNLQPFPQDTFDNLSVTVSCARQSLQYDVVPNHIRTDKDTMITWAVTEARITPLQNDGELTDLQATDATLAELCLSADSAQFWGCRHLLGESAGEDDIVAIHLNSGFVLLALLEEDDAKLFHAGLLTAYEFSHSIKKGMLLSGRRLK